VIPQAWLQLHPVVAGYDVHPIRSNESSEVFGSRKEFVVVARPAPVARRVHHELELLRDLPLANASNSGG
jgi:hypothetical protein